MVNKSKKRKSNVRQNGNRSSTRKTSNRDDDNPEPQSSETEDAVEHDEEQRDNNSCQAASKKPRLTKMAWSPKPPKTNTEIPEKREPKLKTTPKSPLESWSLLFPDELLNVIVEKTNEHIRENHGARIAAHQRETDLTEMKAVIGLFYCIGLYRMNKFQLESMWEPHAPSRFRLTMTLKRFEFLLESLKAEDVWDSFIPNCAKHYETSMECAIVERDPIVVLIDAYTGYAINACLAGNDVDFRKLMEPIHNLGCTVVCKRKLTSVELFEEMKEECGLSMVGEVEESLVPDELKGEMKFGYHKNKTLINYQSPEGDKYLLLSTRDGSDKIHDGTKVPRIVTFYKRTRLEVKTYNNRHLQFSTTRKPVSEPLRLFYAMLDLANENAFILYTYLTQNKLRRRYEFITDLVLGLTHDQMRKRPFKQGLPICLRLQIEEYLKHYEYAPDHDVKDIIPDSKMDQRKLCGYCPDNLNRKTWYECIKCKRPMCYGHQCKLCEACGELGSEDI